ncbi:MAG: sulfatase [Candidatus Latescibacterota bacterium]|nr:MAG: sulfatase [Candidatus Latescibacterota bacterium]
MKRSVLLGLFTGGIFVGIGTAVEALWLTSRGGITFGVYNEAALLLASFAAYVFLGIILGGFVGGAVGRFSRTTGRRLGRSEVIIDVALVIGALLSFGLLATYLFARVLPDDVGILEFRGLLVLLGVLALTVFAFLVLRWLLVKFVGGRLRPLMENMRVLVITAVVVTGLLGALAVVHHIQNAERRSAVNLDPTPNNEISSNIPNVILITLDTVRAQNLDLYGYARDTMPNLAELARSSVVYERAVTHSAWTLPSHQTLFTGRYPSELSQDWACRSLRKTHLTLPEILHTAGYRTAAVVAGPLCSRSVGFGEGFDYFEDALPGNLPFLSVLANRLVPNLFSSVGKRRASQNHEFVFKWLDKNADSPFFLFINYFDAHGRLNPVYPFRNAFEGQFNPFRSFLMGQAAMEIDVTNGARQLSSSETGHWVALYDSEILTIDFELGKLFDKLRALGVFDNTLFVITSDHGHSYGEHDLAGHAGWIFEDVSWVPLVIRYPGGKNGGTRRPNRYGLVNIFGLILEELGFPVPETAHRVSATDVDSVTVLENGRRNGWEKQRFKYANKNLRAIYEGPFKLVTIDDEPAELYNLADDPGGLRNLIVINPETDARLNTRLMLEVAIMFTPPPLASDEGTDDEYGEKLRQQLRALGYIK